MTFDYTIPILAPPNKVLAAFFHPTALRAWWDVEAVVASPRLLGPYALEWAPAEARDEVLGPLGGIYHGTVMDVRPEQGFFVADVYWLPPEGDAIGPMALEVACKRAPGGEEAEESTILRVTQQGVDDSPRWQRYYEVIQAAWPEHLQRLKNYLEHGQGIWDLRGY